MHLERITSAEHPMYGRALELYQISFPLHEQREAFSQEKILHDKDYHFCLIYDKSIFIGILLYWEWDGYIYIEHFCILPKARNQSYGERTLSLLKDGKTTVILEIDPPNDSISVRRKGFYERCGFTENSYRHIHPPYHRGNSGHSLVVMTYPRPISQEEYGSFQTYLSSRIMDHAF